MKTTAFAAGLALLAISGSAVFAAPLQIEARMSPTQQLKLDFKDGSGHFVLFVRREGKSQGNGLLSQMSVTEFGMHDITPGIGGEPTGYLVFAAPNGDEAYVRWNVQATFVAGPDGKPLLLDNGVWRLASGTGQFANHKGAGVMHIKAVSPTERLFTLEGEITPAK